MGYPIVNKEQLQFAVEKSAKRILELGVKHLGFFNGTEDTLTPPGTLDFFVEFEEGQRTFERFSELVKLLEEITERKVELLTPETLGTRFSHRHAGDVQYLQLDQ